MRLKKGFTLAEILIVLMVIGVIATMTVPSMMKNVQEAQYKTAFKKAYNTIANLTAKLGVEGRMPVAICSADGTCAASKDETAKFFIAMMENLSVRNVSSVKQNNRAAADRNSEIAVSYNGNTFGVNSGGGTDATALISYDWSGATIGDTSARPWITSDDGISYTLLQGTNCSSKNTVSTKDSVSNLLTESCLAILVDINGVEKMPNYIEPQSDIKTTGQDMEPLTGDQYYIFVAKDGITTGTKLKQAASRIVADMK